MVAGTWLSVIFRSQPAPLALSQGEMVWGRIGVEALGPFTIGDQIPVRLEVETRRNVECRLPDLTESFSRIQLQVIRKDPPENRSLAGGFRKSQRYLVVSWQTGRFTLPAVNIRYTSGKARGTYTIPGQTLEVVSVLPPHKTAEELKNLPIKGIKQTLPLPPGYMALGWYLLGTLLAGGVFLGFRTMKKRNETEPDEPESPPEPAGVIALRRLAAIKDAKYIEGENYLALYTELSECIRQYMEDRYRIKALEMTTEEFLKRLAGDGRLHETEQQMLKEFLNASDLVKFARYHPSASEADHALESIEHLILVTRETETAGTASTKAAAGEASGDLAVSGASQTE